MQWLALNTLLLSLGLFGGMLTLLELGRRSGARRHRQEGESARAGVAAVDGAVFALMGLLIAFTFASAAGRFDLRKQLIVEETNAIGTAWLRLDLLPADAQTEMRERFRAYVDSRIETYRRMPDLAAVKEGLAHSAELQQGIWTLATTSARESGSRAAEILLLPALNQMFDITTTRAATGLVMHAPPIVFVLLVGSALASALLAGYGMAGSERPSLVHMVGFAALISLAVYVILDLEFPRVGLIRLDAADRMLVDLRASLGG